MPSPRPCLRHRLAAASLLAALGGCGANLETGTPGAALDTAQRLVAEGRLEQLPALVHLDARRVRYEDGVTEASAIEDVREKLSDLLGRLARVSRKLRERFPQAFDREGGSLQGLAERGEIGAQVSAVLLDPFGFLERQRERIEVEDLGDGTAAVVWDDEPALGGLVSMVETGEGWRFTVPTELARASRWWPDSRHEWAVIASMMLGIENSLRDFEAEIDGDSFATLDQAGERAGRLLGESVVVQSIIYAAMKRSGNDADRGSLEP
jgi:hypothetical protein